MPEAPPERNPLLGLDFVFQAGQQKIKEQLSSVDSLDVKMGVLVAFLGALVTGILAALLAAEPSKVHILLGQPVWFGWVILVLLALDAILIATTLVFSFYAFRVREFNSGIRFEDLYEWTNEDPKDIKYIFLPTIKEGIERNEKLIGQKGRSARNAAWFALWALLGLLITAATIVLRLKLHS